MTVNDLRKITAILKNNAIKPYKGHYGLGPEGLFEIKDEAQFQMLRENSNERK